MRRFIFLCTILFAAPAFSQTPYDDIKESDKRVDELRQMLLENIPLPETFRMRFSGTRDNYLSFYDRVNSEMYFRYREDRFDRDAEKKIRNLIPGEAYSVRGKFQGVLLSGRFYSIAHTDYLKQLADKNSVLIFDYNSASPLKPEQILFGSGEIFFDPRFFFQFPLPEKSLVNVYKTGNYNGAEIESLSTGNYLITLSAFQISSKIYLPPPFGNCEFNEIPFSKIVRMQKRCDFKSEKLKREFVFYRKEEKLFLFTLSYTSAGEESAVRILEDLVFL